MTLEINGHWTNLFKRCRNQDTFVAGKLWQLGVSTRLANAYLPCEINVSLRFDKEDKQAVVPQLCAVSEHTCVQFHTITYYFRYCNTEKKRVKLLLIL